MRILVTGAAGFLGQHVCRALEEQDHTVLRVDVVGDVRYVDITMPLSPAHFAGIDAVVHLAAIAAPNTCDADPTLAFDTNVNGTHQVLKLARDAGAKKFVFVSSAHVYGISPKYMPTDEYHPLSLGNTYTTTKILGEPTL